MRAGGMVRERGGTGAVAGTSEEVSPEPGLPLGLRRPCPAFVPLTDPLAGAVLHAHGHVAGCISPLSLAPWSEVQHRTLPWQLLWQVAVPITGAPCKRLGFSFHLCAAVCNVLLTLRIYAKVSPGR